MKLNENNAVKVIERILTLTQYGFKITFGPDTHPKVIRVILEKDILKVEWLLDMESGSEYRDPLEIIDKTIEYLARKIDYELEATKGE